MRLLLISVAAMLIAAASCKKPEGEGGKSSISGNVYVIDYPSDNSNTLDTFPATNEKVFIIYGTGTMQDNDVETNYEGRYTFEYLRAGDYSIYVYGNVPDSGDVDLPIIQSFSIGKKEDFTAQDIYIYGSSKGHSTAKGRVLIKDYDSGGLPKGVEYWGGDIDVYIARAGEPTFFDRTRTNYDGTFVFSRLPRGSYYVYAYSRDVSVLPPSAIPIIVKKEFVIKDFAQAATLDTLVIID
jgi:hypothetical protein